MPYNKLPLLANCPDIYKLNRYISQTPYLNFLAAITSTKGPYAHIRKTYMRKAHNV